MVGRLGCTYAAVAANISTSLAFVTILKLKEKIMVKIPIVIKRVTSDLIAYKTAIAAVGREDASTRPTRDVRRDRPTCE